MRNGFWVCAKACKCQASAPAICFRPFTTSRRVATLLTFATLPVNSRTSPLTGTVPGSGRTGGDDLDGLVAALSWFESRADPDVTGAFGFDAGASGVKCTTALLCPPACSHTKAAAG